MAGKLYTFGHSLLSFEEGYDLLIDHDIAMLVDVRSHPVSKAAPQWNKEELERRLGPRYGFLPNLGGWSDDLEPLSVAEIEFVRSKGVDIDLYLDGHFPKARVAQKIKERPAPAMGDPSFPFWNILGFWDYQWFMWTPAFRTGIRQLLGILEFGNAAIMCAEALWWKCHRSMIADYLLFAKLAPDIVHLQPRPTLHSEQWARRISRYEPEVLKSSYVIL